MAHSSSSKFWCIQVDDKYFNISLHREIKLIKRDLRKKLNAYYKFDSIKSHRKICSFEYQHQNCKSMMILNDNCIQHILNLTSNKEQMIELKCHFHPEPSPQSISQSTMLINDDEEKGIIRNNQKKRRRFIDQQLPEKKRAKHSNNKKKLYAIHAFCINFLKYSLFLLRN